MKWSGLVHSPLPVEATIKSWNIHKKISTCSDRFLFFWLPLFDQSNNWVGFFWFPEWVFPFPALALTQTNISWISPSLFPLTPPNPTHKKSPKKSRQKPPATTSQSFSNSSTDRKSCPDSRSKITVNPHLDVSGAWLEADPNVPTVRDRWIQETQLVNGGKKMTSISS